MGSTQAAYHDRLQMSVCGLGMLWKRPRQRRRKKNALRMMSGLALSVLSSSSVHLWSVMGMMEIDRRVNCFVCLSRRRSSALSSLSEVTI